MGLYFHVCNSWSCKVVHLTLDPFNTPDGLFLSTFVSFVSELGAEADFDIAGEDDMPAYPEDLEIPTELLMIQNSELS